MDRRRGVLVLACVVFAALSANAFGAEKPPAGPWSLPRQAQLPLSFEANRGQTDSQVKFLARGRGYTLFLTAEEAVLSLRSAGPLRMRLVGAHPRPATVGEQELPGKSHYFIGNDPQKWRTNVPNYAAVRYRQVYPGVDLVYYGNEGQLEHDFVVAPGASPRAIRLRVEGADQVSLEENGDLRLLLAGRELRLLRPVIYQQEGAERRQIGGGYVLRARHEVGFQVGEYDRQKPLVIDPIVLSYSSFLGGNLDDEGNAIAVDSAGNAYVTGSTNSLNFPVRGAFQGTKPNTPEVPDVFVAKVNPAGNALVYSTFLGGPGDNTHNGNSTGYAIAVDSSGAAYVAGETSTAKFPVQNAAQGAIGGVAPDAFVAKLNPAGSALAYSTYLGGNGDDYARGIALDSQGNAYVIGETHSTDFPTLNAFRSTHGSAADPRFPDTSVTKLNPAGALAYSTYLGKSTGRAIAVDSAGSAYVTGEVTDAALLGTSDLFPTTPGAFKTQTSGGVETFVTKLNSQGNALAYSTVLGESNAYAIAVDSAGNAYVTGHTPNPQFPTTPNAFQRTFAGGPGFRDAFVTKLNPTGSALVYSTFLGGNNEDAGRAIAVDSVGFAWVTGFTRSTNFPVSGAFQQTFGGGTCGKPGETPVACSDVFITELNASGTALVVSTFFGGNNEDEGHGIAVDSVGYPYVTGFTRSANFPTRNPFQAEFGGPAGPPPGTDAFVVKMIEPPIINPGGTVNGASFASGGAVAPGSIVSVFGIKLAPLTFATAVPLPTSLGGVNLTFNNTTAAPLFFTSPVQTNIQVPWELAGQTTAMLAATVAGQTGPAVSVPLAAFAPGIFTLNQRGTGQAAVQIANTVIFAAPEGSIPGVQARQARKGEFLTIYCTGLGAVTNRPNTGAIALGSPLSTTTTAPTVTIGGASAPVSFSGLSPGFVGLYQVNVQVPDSAPTGAAVNLVISIGGATSNTVTIAVQ